MTRLARAAWWFWWIAAAAGVAGVVFDLVGVADDPRTLRHALVTSTMRLGGVVLARVSARLVTP